MSNYSNAAIACQVVQNASSPVASKFPPFAERVKVIVQVGQDTKEIWENVPTVIQDWQRGETQYLTQNEKGFFVALDKRRVQAEQPQVAPVYASFAPVAPANIPQPSTPVASRVAQTVTGAEYEAQNRDIAAYNKRLAQVYRNCFETVQLTMQDKGLPVELEKDIATSLFIQTTRKFNI